MILSIISAFYPLQVNVTAFNMGSGGGSGKDALLFLVVTVVVVGIIFIINAVRKKAPGKGAGSSDSPFAGFFSGFALRRLGRNIGLNNEQVKMLEFVFKTDQVAEPEKSINNPALLDRHFRRAYRVIEQSSKSNEDTQNRLAVLFSTRNVLENTVIGGLSSSKQLKDNTTIVVSTDKEKYNVLILSNKGEHLAIESPKNALGSMIKFEKGSRIVAMVFTKNNKGFVFETRVVGYTTVYGHTALLLAHSNNLKFLSQRRFRRRQTTMECKLSLVTVEGSGKKQRLLVDKRALCGNLADISVGGCSVKMKASVPVGTKLKIEYTQGVVGVAALGQVLRTNRAGTVTILHIKFLRVARKSMNLINAYVYEYVNE